MRKVFLIFISLLFLINAIYAFDITDSNNKDRTYFSTANPLVKITTTTSDSNFSVTYINANSSTTEIYNLTNQKGEFSIVSFFSQNSFVLTNTNLIIKVGSEIKTIYLDIDKPDFSFISSEVDNENLEIDMVFSYTDNYKIDKLILYKKVGSDLTFIKNFTTENTYSLKIESAGNLELEFQVYDKAGNTQIFEESILVPDITIPKISSSKLILNEGKYSLEFTTTDENLSRYEITQGSLKLSNDISGTSKTVSVNLPFESGDVILSVFDKAENKVSKVITLKSQFTNKYNSKFSNTDEFKFESNANSCYLTSIDSESTSKNFNKNSNEYGVDLDVDENQNTKVDFYCENTNFREYFSRDFYYDTVKPETTELKIEASDEGNLKLYWEEAKDSQSDVSYILYRDDEDIYSGSKLRYTDEKAIYPNTYEYYLEILDEAENKIESNKVSASPKKVEVTLLTNLLKEQQINFEIFSLRVNTDKNSKVTVIVKNNLKEIFKKEYETKNTEIINENLKLNTGVNEIIVQVTDDFSNTKQESFFITYNTIQTNAPSQEVAESINNDATTQTQTPSSTTSQENSQDEIPKEVKTLAFWAWFIFWILIIGICLYIVFFKREILHQIVSIKKNKNNRGYGFSRRKDIVLSKNLDNIKRARINRQRERELEKQRVKREEEMKKKRSELVSSKHRDLAKPKLTPISFSTREKSKKTFKRISKNNKLKEQIKETKSKGRDLISSIKNFFKRDKNKSRVQKEDPLSEYLAKTTSKKNYQNTSDYHFKEQKITSTKPSKKEEKTQELKEKEEEPPKPKEPEKFNKLSLDDYLNKRTKKKRFFFAEKAVEKDLDKRERE